MSDEKDKKSKGRGTTNELEAMREIIHENPILLKKVLNQIRMIKKKSDETIFDAGREKRANQGAHIKSKNRGE